MLTEEVQKVVDWCNEHRKEKGLEPLEDLPLGIPGDAASCPCGTATGLRVNYHDVADAEGKIVERTPTAVHAFARAFDSGHYPQYEQDRL